MIIYLLLVNIAVLISYSLYYLSFRKLTFFQWNRVYLLSTSLFALLIPIGLFIDLSTFFEDDIIPMVNVQEYIDISIVVYAQQNSSLSLVDVLTWIYIAGLLLSLGVILWRLWHVHKMFNSDSPFLGFSFFNKLFLGKEVKSYQSIERHEQIHIEQGHSYDVLFMEFFKALNWFNPVVHNLAKEIKFQHECIADELSSEDKVAYAELLVAHAMKVPHNVLAHEFSNQSFLKKRIMMLFKNKSSDNKRFLYLGIIPAVMVVGLSTIVFNTSRAKNVVAKVEAKIEQAHLPLNEEISASSLPISVKENQLPPSVATDTIKEEGNEIFTQTEILAEPKGGLSAFRKWIGDNYQYPQAAVDAGVKGTVSVSFVVEKDGSLSDIKYANDLGYGTGEAAVELLKKSPKWSPAIQNGKVVRFAYVLPILLDLIDTENSSPIEVKDTIQDKSGGKIVFLNSAPKGNPDYQSVEIIPEPPGGLTAYRKWIGNNFKYPKAAIDAKVKGTIQVTFVVEKDGSLSDLKVVRDLGHGTGEAAINVFNASPKWSPGIQNGKAVRVAYSMPIRLDLTKM